MKKLLWALSVVLVMVIATGVSADIRSDKCNTYSNDLGISAALDNYSVNTCVWSGPVADEQSTIDYYTNKDRNAYLLAAYSCNGETKNTRSRNGNIAKHKKRTGK